MDSKAVAKAHGRLRVATQQLENAAKAEWFEEFADSWYLFLVAAKNVYTTLEQGAKASAQSRQWFGARKNERKSDPLLQYLFQARDDDEHGLAHVLKLEPGHWRLGAEGGMIVDRAVIEYGELVEFKGRSKTGVPITYQETPPHPKLAAVTGRGNVTYHPPTEHKGQPLNDTLPLAVGRLGLAYLSDLIQDAGARVA